MKRYFSLVLVILSATTGFSQDKDLATVNYTLSKLKYNDTAANAQQLDVKLRLPVYQKNKNVLAGMVGYKHVSLNNFPSAYSQSLHGITLQGAWKLWLGNKRSITLFAQAGLFSDMQDISNKDFRYTAGFRYRQKHSDKLSIGLGLAYSRQFFGNQVVPFIDVDYKPNEHWSITGQFPVKPKVLYHLNSKVSAGIEVNGEAASYRLSATEKNNQFIQINQWTGLAKLEWQFAKGWQLNFGLGRNFKQTYKLYNDAATTPWTIITIPLGEKPDPVQKIDRKGLNMQLGISFTPFFSKKE